MTQYPPEWPGVICGECLDHGNHTAVIELTGVRRKVYTPGLNGYDGVACVEYEGWDSEAGCTHWANDPRPLTPAAEDVLAVARRGE